MVKSRQRNRLSTKRASIVPTNHESMAEKVTQTAKANREERKTNRSNPVAIYSSYLHFVCIYFVALENIVGLISSKIDSKNEEQQFTQNTNRKSHTPAREIKMTLSKCEWMLDATLSDRKVPSFFHHIHMKFIFFVLLRCWCCCCLALQNVLRFSLSEYALLFAIFLYLFPMFLLVDSGVCYHQETLKCVSIKV